MTTPICPACHTTMIRDGTGDRWVCQMHGYHAAVWGWDGYGRRLYSWWQDYLFQGTSAVFDVVTSTDGTTYHIWRLP